MKNKHDPSPHELEILRILCRRGPSTVTQINGEIERYLTDNTVIAYLNKLWNANLIDVREKNFEAIYYPLIDDRYFAELRIRHVLERVLDGDTASLVDYILAKADCTPEQSEYTEKIRKSIDVKDCLSPSELKAMKVLWNRSPFTATQIHAQLNKEYARGTIGAIMGRMVDKRYVEAREVNFAYQYRPKLGPVEYAYIVLDKMLEEMLGGDISAIANYILKNHKLTPEQKKCLEDVVQSKS